MKYEAVNPPAENVLIRSKLERPPLPGRLVARPRLVERLEKGLDGRMTLVAAPAGYGKTTLALQWLAQRTGDMAWVSLSHRESEPERFASYLVTAIRNQRPGALAQTAALLDARTEPPWSHFTEVLLSELAVLEEPLLLVLDDYHVIASREVHELVVRMVEELPETLCVAALGRIDPPWPLGRWRGKGWLAELRGRDLRFTPDEISRLFHRAGRTVARRCRDRWTRSSDRGLGSGSAAGANLHRTGAEPARAGAPILG